MSKTFEAKPSLVGEVWQIEVSGKKAGITDNFVFYPFEFKTELEAKEYIKKTDGLVLKRLSISEKIKELRFRKKMRNKQLAEYLGVSESSLKNWIMERFNPDGENMEMLYREFEKVGIE